MALVGWKMMIVCAVVALFSLLAVGGRAEAKGLFDEKDHLTELKLDEAGTNGWSGALKKTDKPGAIFYPGETVNIDIAITNKGKGNLAIKPVLEVVPVGFNFAGYGGMGDPMISGQIMIIRPRGKAVRTEMLHTNIAINLEPGKSVTFELRKLKCERFGLYAIIIEIPGKGRQAVATVFRAHKVPEVDRWESPLMYHKGHGHLPIKEVARLGYKWVRTDTFPNWKSVDTGKGNPFNWTNVDKEMQRYTDNGLYIVSNMYCSPAWSITAANHKAVNIVHEEQYDNILGDFVEEAARRYCGPDGKGPMQIIDYWNEPWEGGGVSGWFSDSIRYRQLYKIHYERAKKGSKHIKVGGASSIMNTEDKFFAYDTGVDYSKMFDVLTDHYVLPHKMYGPRLAKRMGIFSIETETWLGYSETLATMTLAQFLAAGQKMINPNHPDQIFWNNGGTMCKPPAVAVNTCLYFVAGRPFEKVVFLDHLPWLYQFGKGTDAVFLMAGDVSKLEEDSQVMYYQIKAKGKITLDTLGGKLVAYDVSGNPYETSDGKVKLTCGLAPIWLKGEGLEAEAVIDAVRKGKMEGIKPVEIILRDFTVPITKVKTLDVELHNVLNRTIEGTVTVDVPKTIKLSSNQQKVQLKAGERKQAKFEIATAEAHPANAYPVNVEFASEAGNAKWAEVLHVNTITFGTPKIDGDLSDWAKAIPVIVKGVPGKQDLTEAAWMPWDRTVEIKKGIAEVRFMYDKKNFYVALRVREPNWQPKARLSTRDDDKYFGDTPDTKHTYKTSRWVTNPPNPWEAVPYRYHCFQLGIGLGLGEKAHNIPDPVNIPPDMVSMPDTDYEYAVWGAPDGGTEIWRSKYPRGPRLHYFPRILPKEEYNGVPKGARGVVKKDGNDVIYEFALPLADIKHMKPAAGKTVNLTFGMPGSGIFYGTGRSATRINGLTLLPHWVGTPSNTIAWGFLGE